MSGSCNLYQEIAIPLKAQEWRQPGLVDLASKITAAAYSSASGVKHELDPETAMEAYMEDHRDDIETIERCEQEETANECTFYFVRRDYILNSAETLPSYLELAQKDGAIEKKLSSTTVYDIAPATPASFTS